MKKYTALEALRVFAFFNVFWLHTPLYHFFNFYQSAAWAVSFFFILSGFLYGNKYFFLETLSLKDSFKFTLKRFKKLWPLHFITLLCMLPYSQIFIFNVWNDDLKDWLIRFFSNLFLIQSWFNNDKIYYGFTGTAWFLSVIMFLSFITIPIIIILKKIVKSSKNIILIEIIVLLLGYLWIFIVKKTDINSSYWLYIFPPSRIFEYLSGILLGIYFKMHAHETREMSNKWLWTFIEIITLISIIVSFKYIERIPLIWISIGWIIPNCILIYIFSLEKGYFTKILDNKLLIHLGSLTFDAYLIHQVVNIYFSNAIGAVEGLSYLTKLKSSLFILLLTFLIAEKRK